MLKEIWTLICLLFHRTRDGAVEVLLFKHFPWRGYSMMMWCGKLITRQEKYLTPSEETLQHEKIHLQQAQMFSHWWKYYAAYVWDWLRGNPLRHPAQSAYYTTKYEMQAYGNQHRKAYKVTRENLERYAIKHRKRTYKEHRHEWRKYCKGL